MKKGGVPAGEQGRDKMKKILVLMELNAAQREKLEAAGAGAELSFSRPDRVSEEEIQAANVIIGLPRAEMIKASENLELLQLESAGTDAYIVPGVLNEKTILTNATGAYSQAVAEHAFALTLMLQKKLHLYRDEQRAAHWRDRGMVSSLRGSVVAVVGLGDIGSYYARLVKNMGAYVIGVKRRPSACPEYVDELMLTEQLDAVLPRADVIMSVLPNTAATRYIYTVGSFRLMKDSAIFINCGRGNAVSASTLYEVLSQGLIASAGIDVSETEPLPEDSPLWGLENLVITPHVSGSHHLPETVDRIVDICAGNLCSFLRGEKLINLVDFSTGYRK